MILLQTQSETNSPFKKNNSNHKKGILKDTNKHDCKKYKGEEEPFKLHDEEELIEGTEWKCGKCKRPKKEWKCKCCEVVTTMPYKIKVAVRVYKVKHPQKSNFKCHQCPNDDIFFNNQAQLTMHGKKIHGNKLRYKCPEYSGSFPNNRNLKRHQKTKNHWPKRVRK